ncbi:flagellar biosynthesis regulator FlaF [Aurantimonas sp. Leaf443]|uniref:flagellar biosynthesis regulator FlaF n=1 Tax=Aurantimonas sp. Leaf443 TaxID=1736378 RepID=UPI0006FB763C|nr:flagellar biosynthesis regulator FlaF [Aurantimonas sp. Leaf443]KQT82448.1 flagellar biosynthesis regulator FlhF [Aurantimonas sp. Leaf443]
MYQFSYAEVNEDSSATARDRERQALDHAIALLERVEGKSTRSREAIEAIYVTRNLWTILIEDLANAENQLPNELKANLISIGLWVMRETEAIRMGRTDSFAAIADVTRTIRDGLE